MSHYKNDFKCKTEAFRLSWRCLIHNYNCSVLLVFWFLEHTLLVWLVLQFYSDCFLCKTEAHRFIVVLFLILFLFCILSFYALYLQLISKQICTIWKEMKLYNGKPHCQPNFFFFFFYLYHVYTIDASVSSWIPRNQNLLVHIWSRKFVLLGVTLSFFPSSLCRFMSRCFTPHLFM